MPVLPSDPRFCGYKQNGKECISLAEHDYGHVMVTPEWFTERVREGVARDDAKQFANAFLEEFLAGLTVAVCIIGMWAICLLIIWKGMNRG